MNDLENIKIEGEHIEIEIDGVLVHGIIPNRSHGEIEVRITRPYHGIMHSSGHNMVQFWQFTSYIGPKGDVRAASILADLYHFCAYVEAHKTALLSTLPEFDTALDDPDTIVIKQRMRTILQKLKSHNFDLSSGSMDSVQYQQQIAPLKEEMKNLSYEIRPDIYHLFMASFQAYEGLPMGRLHVQTALDYLTTVRRRESEKEAKPHLEYGSQAGVVVWSLSRLPHL